MTIDEYKAAGMSDDDARVAAEADAAKVPPEVAQAHFAEAVGVDPAAAPVSDHAELYERVSFLEEAIARVILHLDPLGTSRSFEPLRPPLRRGD